MDTNLWSGGRTVKFRGNSTASWSTSSARLKRLMISGGVSGLVQYLRDFAKLHMLSAAIDLSYESYVSPTAPTSESLQ